MTHYSPSAGYMTETIQRSYIAYAITQNMLPAQAHRMPQIISLVAAEDRSKPIQFWQLFSVMGQTRILRIVHDFTTASMKMRLGFAMFSPVLATQPIMSEPNRQCGLM